MRSSKKSYKNLTEIIFWACRKIDRIFSVIQIALRAQTPDFQNTLSISGIATKTLATMTRHMLDRITW